MFPITKNLNPCEYKRPLPLDGAQSNTVLSRFYSLTLPPLPPVIKSDLKTEQFAENQYDGHFSGLSAPNDRREERGGQCSSVPLPDIRETF